jgi:adenylate cyclase
VAELFVVNGICAGTVFFLPDVPTVLGRSPESHVQVADPWISSMHALFERRGEQLWVVDLDSRNGTFVDDQRVHEAPVGPGTKLRFGKTSAELRSRPEAVEPQGILSDQRTIIRYVADIVADAASPVLSDVLHPQPSHPTEARREARTGTGTDRRHAAVLNEIGRALLGANGLSEALARLLRALADAIGAERSGVLLMDDRGQMKPLVSEPPDRPPGFSATVVEATLRSRAGILTLDAQQDTRFSQSESIIAQGIRSFISAPIWADNRILGVLLLERGIAFPFTANDLELATLAGFQAALAVERVRIGERERAADDVRWRLARHLDEAVAAPLLAADAGGVDVLQPVLQEAVAVLAVALDGFAQLAAARPPIEAAERALALQRALAQAAQAEGAAVDLRLDGGVLVVFDLPIARQDSLARAQRCAAGLHGRTVELEGTRAPPRLTIRMGFAVGRALLGNFGSADRPELRAMGEVVDLALRRAGEATPGTAAPELASAPTETHPSRGG